VTPSVEIASAVSRTAAARFLRLARGTDASTAPNAINPPVHGKAGAWFAAEPDAVICSVTEPLPLAGSVTVPLAGLTMINGELVVAVHRTVSANVVDASVTATACELPGLSETEAGDGVIVYAGAVTVSGAVPVEAM
jgi:hypothetical protein